MGGPSQNFQGHLTQGPFSPVLLTLVSGVLASWEGTEVAGAYLGFVQIRGVLHHPGVIAIVPQLDDRVKKVGKHLQEGRHSCFLLNWFIYQYLNWFIICSYLS